MDVKSICCENNGISKANYAWIHLQGLCFFLFLGANPYEKKIGQNIKVDLSLQLKFENTEDRLENTLDYGIVVEYLKNELSRLQDVNLLEYLCEQLLDGIGTQFNSIKAAKILIEKGYVPLQNYTGIVKIEAQKEFF
ncbi:MAG: dihydroneopterin aldolase [Bdellovibrionota bacterium]